ncbi:MAG: ChaB family protein, partial [Candidatus Pacearchaeota archaeon]
IFVDGGSVYSEKKSNDSIVDLFAYDYWIGKNKDEKIDGKAYFMYKLFCRSFEQYPTPYLIRRGIYKNWAIIDILKNKEYELVDRIIPYMLLVAKGSEQLTLNNITYAPEDLQGVKEKIQDMTNKINDIRLNIDGNTSKSPIRVTNWDEEIKHLVPDLKSMFQKEIFEQAEKNILAGLGFLDIAEAVSNSRSQSVLNPKPFIKECQSGQSDFAKVVMRDLLALIKEKNPSNIKFQAKKWVVDYNPMTEFMSEAFLDVIKGLNDRGYVSNETTDYVCSLGNINYQIEKRKRIREIIDGDLVTMYPKKTVNTEKDVTSEEEAQTKITNPDEMTDEEKENRDKKPGSPEVEKYKSSLEEELIDSILENEPINDELVISNLDEIKLIETSVWRKKRTTANYLRRGQTNPNKFQKDSFKTIWIAKTDGVRAIIGKLIGDEKTSVQSYLFEKSKWTDKEVDKWVLEHSNKVTSKVELIGSPYSDISELPKGVKRLPFSAQKIWMAVFNSEYGKNGEVAAIQMAWGEVKKHYHKNIIGIWKENK